MILTADLPGTGGVLRSFEDDFLVEEIPAYLPSGDGPHVLATVEKRGVATQEAVRRLAAALGVRAEDVGAAGLKDRHAVARQQLSFPPPLTPEAVLAVSVEGVRVLAAARHGNKLRTGHLRGNRFVLRLRDLPVAPAEAAERARAVLARLAEPPGAPNLYGEQRFAPGNVDKGRALARGERVPAAPREKRFLISAFQSFLFNQYLESRFHSGLYATVITGDLLAKPSGALFASTDPAIDQPRLLAGEVVPTGPMFGHQMRAPAPGTEAAAREAELLAAEGLTLDSFRRLGKLAEGTRRAIGVRVGDPVARADGDAVEIGFSLPAGAYATVVAREIMKEYTFAEKKRDDDDDLPNGILQGTRP